MQTRQLAADEACLLCSVRAEASTTSDNTSGLLYCLQQKMAHDSSDGWYRKVVINSLVDWQRLYSTCHERRAQHSWQQDLHTIGKVAQRVEQCYECHGHHSPTCKNSIAVTVCNSYTHCTDCNIDMCMM